MATGHPAQKSFPLDTGLSSSLSHSGLTPSAPTASSSSGFLSPVTNLYTRFSGWRSALGLPNPGTVENLSKEVKSTQLTNFMFDGARADLSKSFSINPGFHLTHSFTLGSQTQEPSYNLNAVFVNPNTLFQGSVDHDGNLNGRLQQGWSNSHTSKVQMQLARQVERSMIQFEHDYAGQDYALNFKTINPSPADASGLFFGSYLQSVTKNLALGIESLLQRAPDGQELNSSYLLKYTGNNRDWIATAQLQPAGAIQATYWQKLGEKLEIASEMQILASSARRDAVASVAAKWDLRMSTFRAQLDTTGKVSALLEQRFAPSFSFLVSGEIDHFKNATKVGVGVMLESSSLTPEEMGMIPQ